ncbi:unnamed protein product [Paramecium primaurelia]|uniref:Enolase C-terminal domain-containing protein n=1 Tax=Paramecium primaurelia TaxID=5886 RepID=A0A8S1PVW8_PARPR|nr:unnamed protein product [Paramecium primaurelia]
MYKLQPFILNLVNPFGTNHSVTTQRTNAYLEITYLGITGIAEAGLPPKKQNCYFTDYNDIEVFFKIFQSIKPLEKYDGFDQFKQTPYFKLEDGEAKEFLNSQLSILDQIPNDPIHLASKSLFECALIDWYCKKTNKSISQFISNENNEKLKIPNKRNFYTISLLENIDEVISQLDVGLPYTPNIKIKVGGDLEYIRNVLIRVYDKIIKDNHNFNGLLSIDCNSSWQPETALKFLDILNTELIQIKPYLYMIEQPFPLNFDKEFWYIVKEKYQEQKIEIYADESIKTQQDVIELQKVVTGVNVKLEKSSGYRGAIANFIKAEELMLKKWVGIMIGSSLIANQAINLLGLATIGGDIDGTLLVEKSCHKVDEQFIWHKANSEFWGMISLK